MRRRSTASWDTWADHLHYLATCRQLLLFPGGLDDDMQPGRLQMGFGLLLEAGYDLHWPEPKARRRRSLTPAPAYRLPPLFLWPTACQISPKNDPSSSNE